MSYSGGPEHLLARECAPLKGADESIGLLCQLAEAHLFKPARLGDRLSVIETELSPRRTSDPLTFSPGVQGAGTEIVASGPMSLIRSACGP
jgi:hypothetical protein